MTVNNVNALLTYGAGQTGSQTQQTGNMQSESAKSNFDQVMSKVNDAMSSLRAELAGNASAVSRPSDPVAAVGKDVSTQKTENDLSDSGRAEDTMQQGSDNKVVKDTDTGQVTDKTAEELEKAGEELVKDIAEEMGVTPEEVEEAMAELGLVPMQLFDIDNLKQLLLTISGSVDELSLVTNETLYANLQNLLTEMGETLEGLQETLGLSEEELDTLMQQVISGQGESDMQDALLTPENGLEGMQDYTVSVQKDGETVQIKVTVDDASGSKSVQEEVTDAPKEAVQGSHKMRERDASADSGRGEGGAAGNALFQTPDKPVETVETPAPVSAGYQSAQTQDIMNQIMDYMKINLKAETQEMELRLHPASLGTVNVQIAAKDGAITAQFTTQNEAVRAVIETQLIQLKNQFEEQGIKVDAVEVLVENHNYGEQFSQENQDGDQKQGKASKGTRRINLDELEGEEEIAGMEDSERIAVEMMQANGSTVDYMA